MKEALVLYWSKTGNTKRVAESLAEGLRNGGALVSLEDIENVGNVDFFDYDLLCIGCPSYRWCPPQTVIDFLESRFGNYRKKGYIKINTPEVAGKNALVFCTYSGPHTGMNEAVPVNKYMGQFFEHLGFRVVDEWHILSEFHGSLENSTKGRMGDIRGLPDAGELQRIKTSAARIIDRI